MKKLMLGLATATATLGLAAPASAGLCDGEGSHYAQHHIVPLAQAGMLGDDEHKPGTHRGRSICK